MYRSQCGLCVRWCPHHEHIAPGLKFAAHQFAIARDLQVATSMVKTACHAPQASERPFILIQSQHGTKLGVALDQNTAIEFKLIAQVLHALNNERAFFYGCLRHRITPCIHRGHTAACLTTEPEWLSDGQYTFAYYKLKFKLRQLHLSWDFDT